MLVAFLLVIGAAFYLVAFSTIRLVGDALFDDTIRAHMNKVRTLSVTLGERVESDSADAFYQRLLQAASQSGGRLLVVDTDGKVTYDTFGERCGTLLSLAEVRTVLRGETDGDYGFHLASRRGQDTDAVHSGQLHRTRHQPCLRRLLYCAAGGADGRRVGVLILLSGGTGNGRFADFRARPHGRYISCWLLPSCWARLAGLISRIVTKPVRELTDRHRAHEQGRL